MFDDSGSRITDALSGKTIDHVIRNGLDLEIVTTDGHSIVLAADVDYNIQFKKQNVSVMLTGLDIELFAGKL